MIHSPSPSFYLLRANGEAAELIASVFSPGTTSDIVDVVVLSKEFNNDIEPILELDASIEALKGGLAGIDLDERIELNPLFLSSSKEALENALDHEPKTDGVRFTAMEGNPYVVKSTEIRSNDQELITASVAYRQFDLPSYDSLIESSNQKPN